MTTEFLPIRNGYQVPVVLSHGDAADHQGADELIVLCHGISTHKNEYLDFLVTIEDRLNRRGISTVRLDFRGHGESSLSPKSFSVGSQVVDLFNVVQWARERSPKSRMSFFGVSFGAAPCLFIDKWSFGLNFGPRFLVAPVLDYRRTFLVPESPWAVENFSLEAQKGALEGTPIYISEEFFMTGELFAEMASIDVSSFLKSCSSKVHIMHGVEDDMVLFDISQSIASDASNAEFYPFAGMEHGFTAKGDETGESPDTLANIDRMVQIIIRGLESD